MAELFKKIRVGNLIEAIVTVVLGILLLLDPTKTSSIAVTVIGVLVIIMGVWKICLNLYEKKQNAFALGIIEIIIGVFIITHTSTMLDLLAYIFSIYIIIDGVKELEISIRLASKKASGWFVFALLSVLIIVCGVWMLFTPGLAIATVALYGGIMLIVDGIMGIILIWKWHVVAKKIKEAVEDLTAIDEEK